MKRHLLKLVYGIAVSAILWGNMSYSAALGEETTQTATLQTVSDTATETSLNGVITLPQVDLKSIAPAAAPAPTIKMTLSTSSIAFGILPQPPSLTALPSALSMTVQSSARYNVSYIASDFSNGVDTFPITNLDQQIWYKGTVKSPWASVGNTGNIFASDKGNDTYTFDYRLSVPLEAPEGVYTSIVTYAVVAQ